MRKNLPLLHLSLLLGCSFFSISKVHAQDNKSIARNYYRYHLKRIIDHIVPVRDEQKARLFMDMDTIPFLIMNNGETQLLKADTIYMPDSVFHIVEYYDLDKDGVTDEFHILTKEGKASPDFGFIYDLNKDGEVDYIIFWGGFLFTHDHEIYRYVYHFIDEDYDGKIDLATSSVVNQPGDKLPDPHYVLCIKDVNADGRIEEVYFMHLPEGTIQTLEKENGRWHYITVFGRKEVDPTNADFFSFHNLLLDKVKHF